jgi:hypothetical protein
MIEKIGAYKSAHFSPDNFRPCIEYERDDPQWGSISYLYNTNLNQ